MPDTHTLPSNATKKVIIERYNALLDDFRSKAKALEQAHKQQTEAARHADRVALSDAADVGVVGVVERVDAFRGEISGALSELRLNLATEAERLVTLRRAVELQEARLKELHEIEAAADAMQQLATAYGEERAELEATHEARTKALSHEFEEKKAALAAALTTARQAAAEEETQRKATAKAEAEARAQSRAREEADYIYGRDRTRRLDDDAWNEKRAREEKALADKIATAERQIAERETALDARTAVIGDLEQQVAGFDARVKAEVTAATDAVRRILENEFKQKIELEAVEHKWEKKILEQKITHLHGSLENTEAKLIAKGAELASAQAQVNAIATTAIEGAASQTAFRSVNQIALEQARRPDGSDKSKG